MIATEVNIRKITLERRTERNLSLLNQMELFSPRVWSALQKP